MGKGSWIAVSDAHLAEAVLLPIALALAARAGLASSRVLMPLAFASILGGSLTVIGTSTNVIVRGLMPQYDLAPLRMFELLPVALPIALAGLVYLALAAPRLLPAGRAARVEERYPIRDYLSEVVVSPRSSLAGLTVREADLARRFDLNLLAIGRGEEPFAPRPDDRLQAGDVLLVEGPLEALQRLEESRELELQAAPPDDTRLLRELGLVEALVLPHSDLIGRTLAEVGFRQRYGASVVAVNRHGTTLAEKLSQVQFQVGDVLLLQAGREQAEGLAAQRGLLLLGFRPSGRASRLGRVLALSIFALVILANAAGLLGLASSVLVGCLALFLTRTVTSEEAYRSIDWRLLILIAGMMGYGVAMQKTGAAALLAEQVVGLVEGLGPRGVLAGFYALTLLLTQPMSNQAAALLVFPVSMQVASESGVDPRAMAVTVTLAASCSFLTPLEPSCLLVYSAGGYRFWDYARLGAGLTLLSAVVTITLVPMIWPS